MISKTRSFLRGQRGEGKIGAIIALVVVALAIHVAWEFIPYKIQTAEFESAVEESMMGLAANLKKEDEFLLQILEKSDELKLGLREDQLHLEKVGDTFKFKTEYDVILKMVWGDWVQHIEIKRERARL